MCFETVHFAHFPTLPLPAIEPHMWHLTIAECGGTAVAIETFETLRGAGENITQLEGCPVCALFF